jgi:hypothetical protein
MLAFSCSAFSEHPSLKTRVNGLCTSAEEHGENVRGFIVSAQNPWLGSTHKFAFDSCGGTSLFRNQLVVSFLRSAEFPPKGRCVTQLTTLSQRVGSLKILSGMFGRSITRQMQHRSAPCYKVRFVRSRPVTTPCVERGDLSQWQIRMASGLQTRLP